MEPEVGGSKPPSCTIPPTETTFVACRAFAWDGGVIAARIGSILPIKETTGSDAAATAAFFRQQVERAGAMVQAARIEAN